MDSTELDQFVANAQLVQLIIQQPGHASLYVEPMKFLTLQHQDVNAGLDSILFKENAMSVEPTSFMNLQSKIAFQSVEPTKFTPSGKESASVEMTFTWFKVYVDSAVTNKSTTNHSKSANQTVRPIKSTTTIYQNAYANKGLI